MGRPATGSPKWNPKTKCWEARVSIPGSGRLAIPLVDDKGQPTVPACLNGTPGARCSCSSCQQAVRVAKIVSDRQRREGLVAEGTEETADEWYERFKTYRRQEVGSVDDDAWRWSKWISEARVRGGRGRFGMLPIRDITADDVEDIRDALTAAVLAYEAAGNTTGEGRLAPKTAQNVWAALTTPMKYASTRKGPRELRAREDKGNPCVGIPPPRNGESKRRHWLRPVQWTKLIAWLAPRDRDWADALTVGLYLHLRPGELHELRVKDLDLVAGEVRICRAYDERTKTVTTPKTDEGIRTVIIPPTLLPLLERIARERKAEDRVCPIVAATPEKSRAGIYREFLQAASVDEPAFYIETATHLMIDFRSIRDSGITWRFLAGERAEVVQREAGHEHISTTLAYAKEVQDRRGRYGAPFPSLPQESFGPVLVPDQNRPSNSETLWSGRRDLKARFRARERRSAWIHAQSIRRHWTRTTRRAHATTRTLVV